MPDCTVIWCGRVPSRCSRCWSSSGGASAPSSGSCPGCPAWRSLSGMWLCATNAPIPIPFGVCAGHSMRSASSARDRVGCRRFDAATRIQSLCDVGFRSQLSTSVPHQREPVRSGQRGLGHADGHGGVGRGHRFTYTPPLEDVPALSLQQPDGTSLGVPAIETWVGFCESEATWRVLLLHTGTVTAHSVRIHLPEGHWSDTVNARLLTGMLDGSVTSWSMQQWLV